MDNINYTRQDYEDDLINPSLPHIKSRERFKAFYEELGKDPAQHAQDYVHDCLSFIKLKGKILELGCHWGFNLIYWARQGFECVGVEISENLVKHGLEIINKLPGEIRGRITIINGWIEDFIPPEKYDTVILTEVLEHVIDPLPIVQKAAECLKPDGRLYVSAPTTKTGTYSHVRAINKSDMKYLLSHSGLEVVEWDEKLAARDNTAVTVKLKI